MNVLSAILGTDVTLRRMVDVSTKDVDEYSLFGLFLTDDDEIQKEKLVCRGNVSDVH
ncbi:unnamed protein product [Gongylonema pulchrum]|uniref:TFIIIC_sub6 domain-containing protein n=1 Tax=Gongylonema pulchrum TaxID=637853 RepID=A0A183DIM5_9BILA|nr:unnamed protein product [Gongylonema pulchrum]VDK63545.1 unnamed protein product [Gongylonema pulchrum]